MADAIFVKTYRENEFNRDIWLFELFQEFRKDFDKRSFFVSSYSKNANSFDVVFYRKYTEEPLFALTRLSNQLDKAVAKVFRKLLALDEFRMKKHHGRMREQVKDYWLVLSSRWEIVCDLEFKNGLKFSDRLESLLKNSIILPN